MTKQDQGGDRDRDRDRHDEVVDRVAERLAAQIAEQISAHLAARPPRPAPRPAVPRPGVHTMPRPTTVIRDSTLIGCPIHTGTAADADVRRAQAALRTVLGRLGEAGLPRRAERAVRKQATAALTETHRIVQPQPGQLRRVLHPVATALVTATAGAAGPVVHELVRALQHAMP